MKAKLALIAVAIAALAGSGLTADAKGKKQYRQQSTMGSSSSMARDADRMNRTPGMTTGTGRGAANPSSQGNVGPGTDNLTGKQPGGR
ncbi:hypothetical protein I6F35_10065 [Bradyrhizobium sp. BRP22]|uniref:hypothetical protein n=1 Tax=Bradyrhizobium sp. BRP22 TaxID=2793821 RepID=UPI001CD1CC9E|nr:hypothetical protein [Bradyrhizobium sp. BRP22]MCA1453557.1 hypothetical protein [Bradyrhizobium sp. BRP22]